MGISKGVVELQLAAEDPDLCRDKAVELLKEGNAAQSAEWWVNVAFCSLSSGMKPSYSRDVIWLSMGLPVGYIPWPHSVWCQNGSVLQRNKTIKHGAGTDLRSLSYSSGSLRMVPG